MYTSMAFYKFDEKIWKGDPPGDLQQTEDNNGLVIECRI